MNVRAKFNVTKVSEMSDWNGGRLEVMKRTPAPDLGPNSAKYEKSGIPIREITMSAVCNINSEENRSFAEATPSGEIKFQLNNPACAEEFKVGQTYYVDFIPVENK
jgi:hypothetical protein